MANITKLIYHKRFEFLLIWFNEYQVVWSWLYIYYIYVYILYSGIY